MKGTLQLMAKEKLKETLSFRVTEQLYKEIEAAANDERRDLSDVARALLERGLTQYKQDRQLFEPVPEGIAGPGTPHPGPTIKVPMYEIGEKEKEKKKRRA